MPSIPISPTFVSLSTSLVGVTLNFSDLSTPINGLKKIKGFERLSPGYESDFDKPHIFDMLSWQSNLSDFVGRDKEMAAVREWALSDKTISVMFVTGDGGVGKSRLAAEVSQELHGRGWEAGFYGFGDLWEIPLGKAGTLIVFDYPEKEPEKMEAKLEFLAKLNVKHKIRVLFLTRTPVADWEQTLTKTNVHGRVHKEHVHLEPLNPSERHMYEICHSTAQKASRIFQHNEITKISYQFFTHQDVKQWVENNSEHYSRPLFLVAAGIHAARFPEVRSMTVSATDMVDALVQRENKRIWNTSAELGADEDTLSRILLMATIADALPWETIKNIDEPFRSKLGVPKRWDVKRKLREAGWLRGGAFQSVQPDIVGAGFVSKVLDDNPDIDGDLILNSILLSEDDRWMENLCRLGFDMKYVLKKEMAPFQIVADAITNLDVPFDKLDYLIKQEVPQSVAPLCIAICNNYLDTRVPLKEEEKSWVLNNLGNYYAFVGKTSEAYQAIKESVGIYQRLVDAGDTRFRLELARGLTNIYDYYDNDDEGQQKALTALTKAIGIFEELIKLDEERFLPDLSYSLNNLSILYSEMGEPEKALDTSQKVVTIRYQLVDAGKTEYLPKLASALNNLSNKYLDSKKGAEALENVDEAIRIYRELVDGQQAHFQPYLATAMSVRGDIYTLLKRKDEAKDNYQRAIELFAPYAEDCPDSQFGAMYRQTKEDLARLLQGE